MSSEPDDPEPKPKPDDPNRVSYEPQVRGESLYDQVTSGLMAVVVGALLVFGWMVLILATRDAYATRVSAPVEIIEVYGGGGGSPEGTPGSTEKIDIAENRKDDFRREIMNFIGALAVEGKKFAWNTNDRLRRALELKLFEDQKDSIKLKTLVSAVVDKDTQEKIDIIKARLIKNFGYNEVSATDVLNYVASIFARGDAKE